MANLYEQSTSNVKLFMSKSNYMVFTYTGEFVVCFIEDFVLFCRCENETEQEKEKTKDGEHDCPHIESALTYCVRVSSLHV